jgi:Purple acid Phosphatase, N-terminal domain
MTTEHAAHNLELSRRKLLAAATIAGGIAAAASLFAAGVARAAPAARSSSDAIAIPPVTGLHLQFGADASSEIVVSWHTLQSVRNPRVTLGNLDGKIERVVAATRTSYTDAKSGRVIHAYHAKLGQLRDDCAYLYGAFHEGAEPEFGTFRTAPRGRARFTFTSFGDQATPTLGRRYKPPEGVTVPNPPYVNDNLGSPAAADTTLGVERVQPLFHLLNGDLCSPTSPRIGYVPGGIPGRTTAAALVTVPGCPRLATTRTSLAMDLSVTRRIRPTSRCRRQPARRR